MKYLQTILSNDLVRKEIELNQEVVGYMVQHFPILSKSLIHYTKSNLNKFAEPTLKKTYENIVDFSKEETLKLLHQLLENKLKSSCRGRGFRRRPGGVFL